MYENIYARTNMARQQYEERVREAEMARLAKQLAPTAPGYLARVVAAFGDSLVAVGEGLKARYGTVAH